MEATWKRLCVLCAALCLALSFAGCSHDSGSDDSSNDGNQSASTSLFYYDSGTGKFAGTVTWSTTDAYVKALLESELCDIVWKITPPSGGQSIFSWSQNATSVQYASDYSSLTAAISYEPSGLGVDAPCLWADVPGATVTVILDASWAGKTYTLGTQSGYGTYETTPSTDIYDWMKNSQLKAYYGYAKVASAVAYTTNNGNYTATADWTNADLLSIYGVTGAGDTKTVLDFVSDTDGTYLSSSASVTKLVIITLAGNTITCE